VVPMTEEEARAAFAELGSPMERLERLIRDDCACYQRGRDWFHAAMRESDLLPELGLVVSAQQATLRTLIRAALADESAPEELVASLQVIIDFPFWKALVDAGVPEADAPSVMLTASEAQISRERLSGRIRLSN